MDELILQKINVLITGAAGGIGRALVQKFSEGDFNLLLHCFTGREQLQQFLQEKKLKDRSQIYVCDLRKSQDAEQMFQEIQNDVGRVDICINNHGIWPSEDKLIHELSKQRIINTIETNLLGSIWVSQGIFRLLKHFGPRNDGIGNSICYIGSTSGSFGEAYHSDASCSQAALKGLVMTLKNEIVQLDPYGRVNIIDPGWVVSENDIQGLEKKGVLKGACQTMPLQQLATPNDVAESAFFLSSHKSAKHISGQTITIAGGMEGRLLWQKDDINEDQVRERIQQNMKN